MIQWAEIGTWNFNVRDGNVLIELNNMKKKKMMMMMVVVVVIRIRRKATI